MKQLGHILLVIFFMTGSVSYAGVSKSKRTTENLSSWNDGASKRRILQYLQYVEDVKIPEEDRIAVFDSDGTLWPEMPVPVQAQFAFDRLKVMSVSHPEWKKKQPFKAVLDNDQERIKKFKDKDYQTILSATHGAISQDDYAKEVQEWFKTARHPKFNRLYKDCIYQPMKEVVALLHDHGFKTFIVSGGGLDFMRAISQELYGIPPENVIGSHGKTDFKMISEKGTLVKSGKIGIAENGVSKPADINLHIGRRPIFAAGNSDADLQMLQYVDTGTGKSLAILIQHDDSDREYAYEKTASIGKLVKALDEAKKRNWQVVSMASDFKTIFPSVLESTTRPQAKNETPIFE